MTQYVFTPDSGDGYVPLSRTKSGRLVRKHILSTGRLYHSSLPKGFVDIDEDFLDTVVTNFSNKVCDIVQFPIVDDKNNHVEDPFRNAGEVVKLKREGDKLYSYLDVRKSEAVQAIDDRTLIGASAMLAMDYKDTRTNKNVGPTLLHVAGTNRPHILELEDYEVLAASVDSNGEAVFLTATPDPKENTPMPITTKEEAFAYLSSEHDIDVQALLEKSESLDGVAELSAKLSESLEKSGVIQLSNGDTARAEDIVLAVGQLVEDKTELSGRIEALEASAARTAAEVEVDGLVDGGFIAASQRDAFVELRLSNEETFKALVPEKPIIALSGEPAGFQPSDESPAADVAEYIERVSQITA